MTRQVLRVAQGLVAGGALVAGLCLSLAHPLGHGLLPILFVGLTAGLALRPELWPVVFLGGLPLAGLAPWTAWLLLDEVDLILLACVASGYFVMWRRPYPAHSTWPAKGSGISRMFLIAAAAWLSISVLSLIRDPAFTVNDLDLASTYHQPYTGLRLIKPLVGLILLWPLWRLTRACWVRRGLLWAAWGCVAWVIWERATFAALWDFATRYRVTGPFWETHVGGAALDAFLAAAWPVALSALSAGRGLVGSAVPTALAAFTLYSMMVTYSRVAWGVLVLGTLVWWLMHRWTQGSRLTSAEPPKHRGEQHLRIAFGLASLLLLVQVVMHDGSLIRARFESVERDLRARQSHWVAALELLDTPARWIIGVGPGQFANAWRNRPQSAPAARTGTHRVVMHQGQPALQIEAAEAAQEWAQQHRVVQRVSGGRNLSSDLEFRAKVASPFGPGTLVVELCEKQLIYARRCAPSFIPLLQTEPDQWIDLRLRLPMKTRLSMQAMSGFASLRPLSLSLLSRDSRHPVLITQVSLKSSQGEEWVDNGGFEKGLQHWFFSSDKGHLPWSAHHLFVHVVVETGLLGLACLMAMLIAVCLAVIGVMQSRRAAATPKRHFIDPESWVALAPTALAALAGILIVGLIDSVMNQVRTTHLVFFLMSICVHAFTDWVQKDAGPSDPRPLDGGFQRGSAHTGDKLDHAVSPPLGMFGASS